MEKKEQINQDEKRQILFRGKGVDNGEWVEGSYVRCQDLHTIVYEDNDGFYCEDKVDPKTVGQFTGLKDKNGKEIFEGDIIRELDFWDKPRNYTRQVEWKDASCGFEPFSDSEENCGHCGGGVTPGDCIVVGNIHDNPELLEVK